MNKKELEQYFQSMPKEELVAFLLKISDNFNIIPLLPQKLEKSKTPQIFPEQKVSSFAEQSPVYKEDFKLESGVSKQSSPAEKIQLFRSLFIGREDVFALRWFNVKNETSGYSPVCSNKWKTGVCDIKKYSCSSCPNKMPVSLSDNYIYNHLAGKDAYCRDVIGLYPLIPGDSCKFLALDFDNHQKNENIQDDKLIKWQKDILEVRKVCSEFNIPANIEISRSGNGAHMWIFFSENIPAKTARQLGTLILEYAIVKNHSVPIESFDRMFPNQDEMPDGGYGNLIALPLQGQAVRNIKSVFVNDEFEMYSDQWTYLSNVQKMNLKQIQSSIREILKVLPEFVLSDSDEQIQNQTKQSKPEYKKNENLIPEDFTHPVIITLSNNLKILKEGISEKVLSVFRRTAIFTNPQYYQNSRMRLPLWNIPRFIDCSSENSEYLFLPRGNIEKILALLKENNAEYSIKDEREQGTPIKVDFKEELYDNQKDALKALLKNDIGILSAGTGFGKTITAASLISERKKNTIVIVQTHALLEQWKKAIKRFLGIDAGIIAGGKDKSTGVIDIAVEKSLLEKDSLEVKTRTYKYGMVIIDECHHVSAFGSENVAKSFSAKYVYGLTATPIRRDGHQKIIFMQCGPVLYSTTSKQMINVQEFEHYLIPRFTSFHFIPKSETENNEPNINMYYENVVQNEARNQLIIEDIKNAVANGRTPLILSERVTHLELLKEKLSGVAKNIILLTGKGTAKQKKQQLEELNSVPTDESLIVLATGKYAGEGFDNPRLDTLFLVMPFSWKGTLSQYCGRLHRNFAGKTEVQIYDYVDFRIPVFDKMYQKRLKGYKQLGYTTKTVNEIEFHDSPKNVLIYTLQDYEKVYKEDCFTATKSIVICAPYLSKNKVQNFLIMINRKIYDGVKITVLTKLFEDEETKKKNECLILLLKDAGITIFQKEGLSQKLTVIDEQILWYGSINFLGFTEEDACSMRICESKIASEVEGEVVQFEKMMKN